MQASIPFETRLLKHCLPVAASARSVHVHICSIAAVSAHKGTQEGGGPGIQNRLTDKWWIFRPCQVRLRRDHRSHPTAWGKLDDALPPTYPPALLEACIQTVLSSTVDSRERGSCQPIHTFMSQIPDAQWALLLRPCTIQELINQLRQLMLSCSIHHQGHRRY